MDFIPMRGEPAETVLVWSVCPTPGNQGNHLAALGSETNPSPISGPASLNVDSARILCLSGWHRLSEHCGLESASINHHSGTRYRLEHCQAI